MTKLSVSAVTVTQRVSTGSSRSGRDQAIPIDGSPVIDLALTAEERVRSRHHFTTEAGQVIVLRLPRGMVLQDGDLLATESGETRVRIVAKPEPVLTITAAHPLELLRAAYHLGNRHVSVEVSPTHLRIAPDPVLRDMLSHRGLQLIEEICPFQPEGGAYGHTHA
ncbi:urease accessory protein UreE [Synechococcales cyanobacterium C]|uniref:Urease accessory protein UreE n=1 Tax=Petrachloros mirabilis ULC683 TaxID=2781853 RepID=A0A8K2A0K2_9CYAN|nr:urease accessory protein UreE [Petrachloros mirabilis]NCJ07217.1 urease accessory protein UreE [Petrachloros mirabilis ULC683]